MIWKRILGWAGILAVVFLASGGAGANADEGADLTAYALTFGPGEHPFLKFGHNAILVQPKEGTGWVFNFGTFDFADPELLPKFLRGRFSYWLSVGGAEATLDAYRAEDRTILSQELDLTPAQKSALWNALRENARPENRAYLYDYFFDNCSTRVRDEEVVVKVGAVLRPGVYDYFFDNCSTRVRDAIDRVIGGRIREAGRAPAALTLRAHALRSVADYLPEYLGLYLGLARATDVPIDRWTESFLPDRLADLLRTVRLTDSAGERPLVRSEQVLYQSTRPPKPVRPPQWAGYFLAVGFAVGTFLLFLGRAARRVAAARVAFGVLTSVLGLTAGLLGLILVFFWAFTNHKVAYANANILQLAPWLAVLSVYGIGVAAGAPKSIRRAAWLALFAVLLSTSGIVTKVLPGFNQDNWPIILACLPIWTGLWLGLRRLREDRGVRSS
jgi:hypothetical protein